MLTIDIPHGGSGYGITRWSAWMTDCLIAGDLADRFKRKCTYMPFVIGTMTHEYLRVWREGKIGPTERVRFIDTQCGFPPPQDAQDEAFRLFQAYAENDPLGDEWEILGVETRIVGSALETLMGVSPYTAQLDLIVRHRQTGLIKIVDYKTSSSSGNRYNTGSGRIQMHSYWMAATTIGYVADEIEIHQIVKNKKPIVNIYNISPPTWGQRLELQQALQHALLRKTSGQRTQFLPYCDSCNWRMTGKCGWGKDMPAPSEVRLNQLSDLQQEEKPEDLLPQITTIMGPRGAGKTTLAATLFADISEAMTKIPEEMIILKGACWLLSDDSGLISLRARKIKPEYVIDVRKILQEEDGNADKASRRIDDYIKLARDAGAHTLVHDTVSTYGLMMEQYFVHGAGCPKTNKDVNDTQRGWQLVGHKQVAILQTARMLNMRVLFLSHVTSNKFEEAAEKPKATDAEKARKIICSTPGDNDIVPAIRGNIFRDLALSQASIQGWLSVRELNGKSVREWYPRGAEGAQAKNRYEGIFDGSAEPPDLKAQDEKILKALL